MSQRRGLPLEQAICNFFMLAEGTATAINCPSFSSLTVRHESIIEQTKPELQRLCSYLDLPCQDDYANACASIVFKSPSRSRLKAHRNAGIQNGSGPS
jgi:hypothetical protein